MFNNRRGRVLGGTKTIGGMPSHQRMTMDQHHDTMRWKPIISKADEEDIMTSRFNPA